MEIQEYQYIKEGILPSLKQFVGRDFKTKVESDRQVWGLMELEFVGFCKAYSFKNLKKYIICLYIYIILLE